MHRAPIEEVLLAATLTTIARYTGEATVPITMFRHGRELPPDMDLSRSMGWFMTFFPLLLTAGRDLEETRLRVSEILSHVRNGGAGYSLLRYLCSDRSVRSELDFPQPVVIFNYQGQFDQPLSSRPLLRISRQSAGGERSPANARGGGHLGFWPRVLDKQLEVLIRYSTEMHDIGTVERIGHETIAALRGATG